MEDTNSINRELKKQQLRKQIVSNPNPMRTGSSSYQGDGQEDEGSGLGGSGLLRRGIITSMVVVLIVIAIAGIAMYQNTYRRYTEYTVSWEADLLAGDGSGAGVESSFTAYEDFGENLIKYTKDGATYFDAKGKAAWVQAYEMKAPIIAINGDYAAIADQQGNQIYIFDKNGCQGTATALLPISKVSVSAKGVVAVILEDARSNYITLFKKDGSTLVVIKSRLSGNGYALDISLSPEGNQIICSYMYINQGMMDCRVVFYNFSEIGKNSETRLVGGFDEVFKGCIVPRVHFLDETYSFACSDKGLSFFSSKNLASPELLLQVPMESRIRTLFYSKSYVGVILDNEEGEAPYRMEIYRPSGELALKKEFNFRYQEAAFDGDQILLWNESGFEAYNLSGTQKFGGEFGGSVSKVMTGRYLNSYQIISSGKLTEITLQ